MTSEKEFNEKSRPLMNALIKHLKKNGIKIDDPRKLKITILRESFEETKQNVEQFLKDVKADHKISVDDLVKERKSMQNIDQNINTSKTQHFIFNEDELVKYQTFQFCMLDEHTAGIGLHLPKMQAIYDKKGVFIDDIQVWKPVLITSKNELMEVGRRHKKTQFYVLPEAEQGHHIRWSLASIKQYIEGEEPTINGKELLQDIEQYYKDFMYFHTEEWYTIHALWDIGTYFFLLGSHYPLMELRGMKGTAKTKIFTLSRGISYNASPEMTNPSEATLFRDTHEFRPTKYIDEAEKLFTIIKGKVESDPRAELINSGFSANGSVARQETRGSRYVTAHYKTYSPTMIGSINGLYGATEDRAIIHVTTKAPANDKRGELYPNEDEPHHKKRTAELRDKLYLYTLQNWQAIKKSIDNFENTTKLKNRDLNIWKTLICIIRHLDKTKSEKIISFAEKLESIKGMDTIQEDSTEHKILKAVHEILKNNNSGTIEIKKIQEHFSGDDEWRPHAKTITRHMDSFGFRDCKSRVPMQGNTCYKLSLNKFNDVLSTIFPSLPSLPSLHTEKQEFLVKQSEANTKTVKKNSEAVKQSEASEALMHPPPKKTVPSFPMENDANDATDFVDFDKNLMDKIRGKLTSDRDKIKRDGKLYISKRQDLMDLFKARKDGEGFPIEEIQELVSNSPKSVETYLKLSLRRGDLIEVKHGVYKIND